MMRNVFIMAGVIGAAGALLAGCARSLVPETLDETIGSGTPESEQEFWHRLPTRPAVTNSEGMHGVLLLADGTDPTRSWEERIAVLRERGWLPDGFDEPGNQTIERGTLAKALCHAMDVDGGVMMRLTNKHPRYAIRELAYLRVMASSTENQIVSGLDYIGIMSKAQDYVMLRDVRKAQKASPIPKPSSEAPVDEAPAAPAEAPPGGSTP